MSLWADKHRPSNLSQLTHDTKLTEVLRFLASSGADFPHLLVYGPPGSGKKTRVFTLLKALYGNNQCEKMKVDVRETNNITSSGSLGRKIEFNVISSPVHLEITPSDVGNYDRLVVSDVVKGVGAIEAIDFTALIKRDTENGDDTKPKIKFKIVIINQADKLTHDAQASLRRTMEKYSANVRLILVSDSTSGIIDPIKSRTLGIRVALPDKETLANSLESIVQKERDALDALPNDLEDRRSVYDNITEASEHNLRLAIMMLEAMVMNNQNITASTKPILPDWLQVIVDLARAVLRERTVSRLTSSRSVLYELLSHAIPGDLILSKLVQTMFTVITQEGLQGVKDTETLLLGIVEAGAQFDERLKRGSKDIFHLEGFLAKVMVTVEKSM